MAQLLSALTFHFEKTSAPKHIVPWFIQPGLNIRFTGTTGWPYYYWLKVVRMSEDQTAKEYNEYGFQFYVCGRDDKEYKNKPVPMNEEHCKWKIPDGVAVPAEQFLYGLTAAEHAGKMILKILTQTGTLFIGATGSAMSSGFGGTAASGAANAIGSYLDPDTISQLKRDFTVYKIISEFITIGAYVTQKDLNDPDFLLTRMLPFNFDNLDASIESVLDMFLAKNLTQFDRRIKRSPGNPTILSHNQGYLMQMKTNVAGKKLWKDRSKPEVPEDN